MNKILIAFVVLLAGCATEAGYRKAAESWIGAPEEKLVQRWGPPDQFYETGKVKYLQYRSSRNVYMPGVAPTYQVTSYGNTAYATPIGGMPGSTLNMQCQITFEVQDGFVSNASWKGNDCRAR
jgi:hypothetical protein